MKVENLFSLLWKEALSGVATIESICTSFILLFTSGFVLLGNWSLTYYVVSLNLSFAFTYVATHQVKKGEVKRKKSDTVNAQNITGSLRQLKKVYDDAIASAKTSENMLKIEVQKLKDELKLVKEVKGKTETEFKLM